MDAAHVDISENTDLANFIEDLYQNVEQRRKDRVEQIKKAMGIDGCEVGSVKNKAVVTKDFGNGYGVMVKDIHLAEFFGDDPSRVTIDLYHTDNPKDIEIHVTDVDLRRISDTIEGLKSTAENSVRAACVEEQYSQEVKDFCDQINEEFWQLRNGPFYIRKDQNDQYELKLNLGWVVITIADFGETDIKTATVKLYYDDSPKQYLNVGVGNIPRDKVVKVALNFFSWAEDLEDTKHMNFLDIMNCT